MKRIELIRNHPVFIRELDRLAIHEKDRPFCGHDMQHLLDVARIAWILVLENNISLKKDIVYAAALLHDIAKGMQYEGAGPHNINGAEMARPILKDCGYSEKECDLICEAILYHRVKAKSGNPLVRILYKADKKSRACYMCPAAKDCNWPDEKKTSKLNY